MPPIADMEKFLKGQLDARLANGKAPLSLSTIYGWCAPLLPGAAGAWSLLALPPVLDHLAEDELLLMRRALLSVWCMCALPWWASAWCALPLLHCRLLAVPWPPTLPSLPAAPGMPFLSRPFSSFAGRGRRRGAARK